MLKQRKKYCKQNGKLFNKKFVNVTGESIIFRLFNSCQGLECFVVTIHTWMWDWKTHTRWMQINIVKRRATWEKKKNKKQPKWPHAFWHRIWKVPNEGGKKTSNNSREWNMGFWVLIISNGRAAIICLLSGNLVSFLF